MKKLVVIVDEYCLNKAVWIAYKKHIIRFKEELPVDILVHQSASLEVKSEAKAIGNTTIYESVFHIYKFLDFGSHILHANIVTGLRLLPAKLFGVKVIMWCQGALPDESYMRNQSFFRYKALSLIEYVVLSNLDSVIWVSRAMKKYYEVRYGIKSIEDVVVPCFSDLKLAENRKKVEESFVYIGGMSVWQCVEETLQIFKSFYESNPKSRLTIVTAQQDQAKIFVDESGLPVGVVNIKTLSNRRDVEEELSSHMYGFLIRRDDVVNKISSPIKFCEYLSCGVTPIISEGVGDYSDYVRTQGVGAVIGRQKNPMQLGNMSCKSDSEIIEIYKSMVKSYMEGVSYKKLVS